MPGQPITVQDCQSFQSTTGFTLFGQPDPITGVAPVTATVAPTNPAFVNLEAACFGTPGISVPDPNALRTFAPGLGRIFSLQNVATSTYNAMQMTLRRSTGPLTLGVSYSYSHSIDDSSDRSDTTLVNALDIASNKASSNFDQRHLLNISYLYKLDSVVNRLRYWFSNVDYDASPSTTALPEPSSFGRKLFEGWELSGITTLQSGTPFSVINGGSSNGISVLDNAGVANGTGAGSYPDVIGNPHLQAPYGSKNPLSIGPALLNSCRFCRAHRPDLRRCRPQLPE